MSKQQSPLTYENVLEMFRRASRRMKKTERMIQETSAQMKESEQKLERMFQESAEQLKATQKEVGKLGSRIGEIVVNMVKGNIVEKFQNLGYNDIDDYCEKKKFGNKKLGIRGEIDLFLENGDIAILIEVKTTLETADVRDHVERLEKFRRCVDAKGVDKRRFIGAVAGAVVEGDAEKVAHENGIYVIVQSGDAVEIVTPPMGFRAKEW